MKLEEYAALNMQGTQEEPEEQEVLTVEQVAAKLDAEKYYSLMAQLQEAIEEEAAPAEILQELTGAVFGTSSPQAAAVARIIDTDKHPGGHEMAIAVIRQRKRLLNQQARQLEAQATAIAEEIAALEAHERELSSEKADAAALDTAIIDTLTACKCLDLAEPGTLQQLQTLYNRHKARPAAMGLLYGTITELTRKGYSTGNFDLIQQREFIELRERIAAAAKG